MDPLQPIFEHFTGFNPNADGDPDIESVQFLDFEEPLAGASSDPLTQRPLVVVLVEDRLMVPSGDASTALKPRLIRWKHDLAVSGYGSRFIGMTTYAGLRRQNGRCVLALRKFLQAVRATYPNLAGAVLFGDFPEAGIVRRSVWKIDVGTDLWGDNRFRARTVLQWCGDLLADRSDLMLADLEGPWETLYQEQSFSADFVAVAPYDSQTQGNWPLEGRTYTGDVWSVQERSYQDIFFIDDNAVSIAVSNATPTLPHGELAMTVGVLVHHPEAPGSSLPNPVAIPTISVSRINARHIALVPDPQMRGVNGEGFLDANGQPQIVTVLPDTTFDIDRPRFWVRDHQLELRLLAGYLDRNNAYRGQGGPVTASPWAAATCPATDFPLSTVSSALQRAEPSLQPGATVADPTIEAYVGWLKTPTSLRGIIAHSDPWGSMLAPGGTQEATEQRVGGPAWWWERDGDRYVPRYRTDGRIDMHLHRAIWNAKTLPPDSPHTIIHGGCQVNSAADSWASSYADPAFGFLQNAEGMLFYLNAVAVIARAKVYNDWPDELMDVWRASHCLGDAMTAWFRAAGNRPIDITRAPCRTRTYDWGLLGDWTLPTRPQWRIPRPPQGWHAPNPRTVNPH